MSRTGGADDKLRGRKSENKMTLLEEITLVNQQILSRKENKQSFLKNTETYCRKSSHDKGEENIYIELRYRKMRIKTPNCKMHGSRLEQIQSIKTPLQQEFLMLIAGHDRGDYLTQVCSFEAHIIIFSR